MSSQKIKFGDKEVDKKEFYSFKQAILLDAIDLNKIVVSNKWKIKDATYKVSSINTRRSCGINMSMRAYSYNKNKITRSFVLISFIYNLKT